MITAVTKIRCSLDSEWVGTLNVDLLAPRSKYIFFISQLINIILSLSHSYNKISNSKIRQKIIDNGYTYSVYLY